jgi:hypothetical protein
MIDIMKDIMTENYEGCYEEHHSGDYKGAHCKT